MARKRFVIWCVLALGTAMAAAGCTSVQTQAQQTEDLLVAAGFVSKTPTTAEQVQKLQSLKPLQMVKVNKDGQTWYVYPDPDNCKCAYVGNEQQYTEYKKLAIEQNIARENYEAAEMMEAGPEWGWWW